MSELQKGKYEFFSDDAEQIYLLEQLLLTDVERQTRRRETVEDIEQFIKQIKRSKKRNETVTNRNL